MGLNFFILSDIVEKAALDLIGIIFVGQNILFQFDFVSMSIPDDVFMCIHAVEGVIEVFVDGLSELGLVTWSKAHKYICFLVPLGLW